MKTFLYSAYVLTLESRERLLSWLAENGKTIKANEYLHHSTIEYGADTLVPDSWIGMSAKLYIFGYVENEFASAFAVNIGTNIPGHVTISTAEGFKAVEAKYLTEFGKIERLPALIEIDTIITKFYAE